MRDAVVERLSSTTVDSERPPCMRVVAPRGRGLKAPDRWPSEPTIPGGDCFPLYLIACVPMRNIYSGRRATAPFKAATIAVRRVPSP